MRLPTRYEDNPPTSDPLIPARALGRWSLLAHAGVLVSASNEVEERWWIPSIPPVTNNTWCNHNYQGAKNQVNHTWTPSTCLKQPPHPWWYLPTSMGGKVSTYPSKEYLNTPCMVVNPPVRTTMSKIRSGMAQEPLKNQNIVSYYSGLQNSDIITCLKNFK